MATTADERLYTCLPLFHGAAQINISLHAFYAGATVVLGRRFSASRFWDELRRHGSPSSTPSAPSCRCSWRSPRPTATATTGPEGVRRPRPPPSAPRLRGALRRPRRRGLRAHRDQERPYNPSPAPGRLARPADRISWSRSTTSPGTVPRPGRPGRSCTGPACRTSCSPATTAIPRRRSRPEGPLVAHRRPGLHRRGRLLLLHRPQEGRAAPPRREHLLPRGRVGPARPPRRRRRRRRHAVGAGRGRGPRRRAARTRPRADLTGLFAHCDRSMPHFMVPRYYRFVDRLPVTPTGKVRKHHLRDRGRTEPGTRSPPGSSPPATPEESPCPAPPYASARSPPGWPSRTTWSRPTSRSNSSAAHRRRRPRVRAVLLRPARSRTRPRRRREVFARFREARTQPRLLRRQPARARPRPTRAPTRRTSCCPPTRGSPAPTSADRSRHTRQLEGRVPQPRAGHHARHLRHLRLGRADRPRRTGEDRTAGPAAPRHRGGPLDPRGFLRLRGTAPDRALVTATLRTSRRPRHRADPRRPRHGPRRPARTPRTRHPDIDTSLAGSGGHPAFPARGAAVCAPRTPCSRSNSPARHRTRPRTL